MKDIMKIVGGVLLVCFVIAVVVVFAIAVPLAFIWSINTLFALTLAYTLKNWFCAWLIIVILQGSSIGRRG